MSQNSDSNDLIIRLEESFASYVKAHQEHFKSTASEAIEHYFSRDTIIKESDHRMILADKIEELMK